MATTIVKYSSYKWHELTATQQAELTGQMNLHKVPKHEQHSFTYLIRPDGSVYGYQYPL